MAHLLLYLNTLSISTIITLLPYTVHAVLKIDIYRRHGIGLSLFQLYARLRIRTASGERVKAIVQPDAYADDDSLSIQTAIHIFRSWGEGYTLICPERHRRNSVCHIYIGNTFIRFLKRLKTRLL